ncbi:MAG: cell division protein FtsZ [Bacteroidales bacterium]|nr:cell division protein FtsZ [Bacteroidales bacterium]
MENNSNDTLQFGYAQTTEQMKTIIKVVGVGGGGSNAVRNMFKEGIEDVSFLIVNTDKAALEDSPIPNKLQISEEGLGAGAQPEKAQAFALQYEDAIRTALSDGSKMVFITAGMGGGTGTGASPVVARIAHEMGILTIGIVTIPFKFEGQKKIRMALQGVAEIRKYVDALLVVNNNRLIDIYPDLKFFNAFKKADDTLTYATRSISDIINKTGYINLDFADVEKTLKNSGVALISMGEASGEHRVTKAIETAIVSPLLQDNKITEAKRLLFEICFSEKDPVSMEEIEELNHFVEGLSPDIEVIWGALQDDSLNENVRIIILAAGFEMDGATGAITPAAPNADVTKPIINENPSKPEVSEQPKEPEQPEVPEEPKQPESPEKPTEEPVAEETPKEPESAPQTETVPEPVEAEEEKPQPTVQPAPELQPTSQPVAENQPTRPAEPTPVQTTEEGLEEISRYYGAETAEEMRIEQIRKNYYVLDNADLSNEELVSMLEQMPAYNRSYEQLCELKSKSKAKTANQNNDGNLF